MFKRALQFSSKTRAFRCNNNNLQFMRYAVDSEAKATLTEEVKSHLKPDVLQLIESKSDYALVKRLNKIGKLGAIRLNTASKLQLQSLNAQNLFKMVSKVLEDPWVYYWTKVCDNGTNPEKWLASLKELQDTPALVDRCFRQMMLCRCQPAPEHYAEFMKAAAVLGDMHTACTLVDDYYRCSTDPRVKEQNPEFWRALLDTFLNAKEYEAATLFVGQIQMRKVEPTPEQMARLDQLKEQTDQQAEMDFVVGKTLNKPAHVLAREEFSKSTLDSIVKQLTENIQPSFDKLISPDEVAKRKYEREEMEQKQ